MIDLAKNLEELFALYQTRKEEIKKRLKEFKEVLNESDERIFTELSFCLCTPQSKATVCWNSISSLAKNNLLFKGSEEKIRPFLNPVRFAGNKAKYIIESRKFFTENGRLDIKNKINSFENNFELREWLVKNIKGFGMKEASHFLRNVGLGDNLAILDRHILKNLACFGIIEKIPDSLTKKKYLEIEKKLKEFSEEIKIPMEELDLLFWSKETGMIFK